MKIKFVGSQGASKAYSLGTTFTPDANAVQTLAVYEDIGLLYSIEIVAHGHDSWNPVDLGRGPLP